MADKTKSIAFTGHRYLKNKGQEMWAHGALEEACLKAAKNGFNWFCSGGAPYWDWWFLESAMRARWHLAGRPAGEPFAVRGMPDGIVVTVALPFRGFLDYYAKKRDDDRIYIKNTIMKFVEPIILVESTPAPNERAKMTKLIHARNRWLVDNHDVIIGLFDGRQSGGTFATLKYARKKGKRILWLDPKKKTESWINTGS